MIANLGVALYIALHVWGAPACGQPLVVWQDLGPRPLGAVTEPQPTPCVIMLNSRHRRLLSDHAEVLCTTIVHEWGHLTGHGHSSDPHNIMYPTATRYWRCHTKRPNFGFPISGRTRSPRGRRARPR